MKKIGKNTKKYIIKSRIQETMEVEGKHNNPKPKLK